MKATKSNNIKKERESTVITKKAMIAALEKSLGIVSAATKKTKINRTTHYKWLESDPEYKDAVESISETAIDFAETKLMSSINNGSDTAIIFFLKTKGKKRGYVEKQELEHSGKIESTLNESKLDQIADKLNEIKTSKR